MIPDAVKRIAILVGAVAIQEAIKRSGLVAAAGASMAPAPVARAAVAGLSDDFMFDDGSSSQDAPSDINVPFQQYSPYQQQGYSPYQQPYGYQQPSYPAGYAQPINPYVQPQYNPYAQTGQYQQPYNPYMQTGPYGNPATTYPPVQPSNPFASLLQTMFGQTPNQAANMNATEALYDSLIQYGIQSGVLRPGFCAGAATGQSQYHNCTFTVTLTNGRAKTVNFATAARMMKKYQTTGKLA